MIRKTDKIQGTQGDQMKINGLPKQYYKNLKHNSFEWAGFWDNFHHFVKGNNRTGFLDIAVTQQDIADNSWWWFCDNEITRDIGLTT